MSECKILVFGTGGHAESVFDCLTKEQRNSLVAFVAHSPTNQDLCGVPIWSHRDAILELKTHGSSFRGFIAIGDNHIRSNVAGELWREVPGFEFINVVHASARVSESARLGQGVFVGALSSIGPNAHVQDFAIVNTLANVEHGAVVGQFASLGPNSAIAGNSIVGGHAIIGMSAAVLQKISIGNHSLIGASSLIVSDVPPRTVYFGKKAKFKRERLPGERYL